LLTAINTRMNKEIRILQILKGKKMRDEGQKWKSQKNTIIDFFNI